MTLCRLGEVGLINYPEIAWSEAKLKKVRDDFEKTSIHFLCNTCIA